MIKIFTNTPQKLLDAIYAAIDNQEIDTWTYDKEKDFRWIPTTSTWQPYAYFHPVINSQFTGKPFLLLRLITFKDLSIRKADFAAYHGHFIQMVMTHFGAPQIEIESSSLPATNIDNVTIIG